MFITIRLCSHDFVYAGEIAFVANIIGFILPFYQVLFLDESVIADVISRRDRAALHGARREALSSPAQLSRL